MLDLQPRVHLEEIEVAVLVDDELDRAGALVVDRLGQRHRLLAHGLPRLLVEERRRRLLHDLLVAALDRAFALAEIDALPCASASTWISMWRGSTMNFSMKTRSSPNELLASERARSKPSRTSALSQAMRMPLPPPPAEALIITG